MCPADPAPWRLEARALAIPHRLAPLD
ncbi:cobalamin ABC transporter ATP-binding protein, partial [Aeromonas caviae]